VATWCGFFAEVVGERKRVCLKINGEELPGGLIVKMEWGALMAVGSGDICS
jgi:hypothetical protein